MWRMTRQASSVRPYKTDRRVERTELNSALPFHILASLESVHIEADSGTNYLFRIAGAQRENGGLLVLTTATGDSLVVKGRAVELRTADGGAVPVEPKPHIESAWNYAVQAEPMTRILSLPGIKRLKL